MTGPERRAYQIALGRHSVTPHKLAKLSGIRVERAKAILDEVAAADAAVSAPRAQRHAGSPPARSPRAACGPQTPGSGPQTPGLDDGPEAMVE
jgi:hypothetical protein